ncbi:MAG TPA: hypothetical protein GXX51_06360 [Firmicutes bacterium]|nr:hypothetical protein [Bacillota bacterium]
MSSHIIDFSFLGDQFGSAQVRRIFSEEATLQKWLDVEAALATVEARHGLVQEEAAAEISAKAKIDLLDMAELKRQADTTWHPVVPLIRAFEAVCAGMAGEFIHWGATSYDIINTGMVLQVKEVYGIFLEHLKELDAILCSLARKHTQGYIDGGKNPQAACPSYHVRVESRCMGGGTPA